jgi:hypothetical protein
MARHYSTKSFFRNAPNALLARYFRDRGVLADFDFAGLKEGNPDPLFNAWLALDEAYGDARQGGHALCSLKEKVQNFGGTSSPTKTAALYAALLEPKTSKKPRN